MAGSGWLCQLPTGYRTTPQGQKMVGVAGRAVAVAEVVAGRLGVGQVALRHVEVLVAVAATGSISGAARHLRLPQPSVSAQVARIERRWGRAQFDRTPTGVRPTALLRAALPEMRLLAQLGAEVRSMVEADVEPISSGTRLVSEFSFTGLLDSLRADGLTDVEQHVIDIPGPDWPRQMVDADVCFYADLPLASLTVPPGHETTVAFDDPAYVLMPPDLAQDRTVVGLAELAGHDWLTGPAGSRSHRSVVALCRSVGFEPRIRFTVQSGTAGLRIVESGAAVALTGAALVPGPGLRAVRLAEDLRVRMTVGWRRGGSATGVGHRIASWLRDAQVTRLTQVRPELLAEMRENGDRWPLYAQRGTG